MKQRRLKVTLITGRTIDQGAGKERGKLSKEYNESVSICFVDPKDLEKLEMKEKSAIQVSTEFGSVVVEAVKSRRGPHTGIVFIPYGPWANVIVDPETNSIGMPSFKGIPAEIEPVTDKPIRGLRELLQKQFGKE